MFHRLFFISTRQKLPRLRHHLTSGRKMDSPDEGAAILLQAGVMRDWTSARHLIKSRGKTPAELFWELSQKPKANWRRRLRFRLIRFLGWFPFDPHAREMREVEYLLWERDK
jgi:hypothetical protein